MLSITESRYRQDPLYPIARKLSATEIAGFDINSLADKSRITKNAVLAIKEIAPDLNWEFVDLQVDAIHSNNDFRQRTTRGIASFEAQMGQHIMGLARQLEWGIDQPEMVYAFGFFVQAMLKDKQDRIAADVSREGVRKFVTPEHKEKRLSEEKEMVRNLDKFTDPFGKALSEFAGKYLLRGRKYLIVLQKIMSTTLPYAKRSAIVARLRKGNIEEAYEILSPQEENI